MYSKVQFERLVKVQQLSAAEDGNNIAILAEGRDNLVALDIGCFDGLGTCAKYADLPNVRCALGIDREHSLVDLALSSRSTDKITFACGDCETDAFDDVVVSYLQRQGSDGFDIVSLTMVLLLIEDPLALLIKLRNYMRPGGIIYIRDVDDGRRVVYPDPDGFFERAKTINMNMRLSGDRICGRKVPTWLYDAGYHEVKTLSLGSSSLGMSKEERYLQFDASFVPVLENLRMLCDSGCADVATENDRLWLESAISSMREHFVNPRTFCANGSVAFFARAGVRPTMERRELGESKP